MKTFIYPLILMIALLFSSCSIIGGIFKAGMGVGIFLSALFVGGILYFIFRSSGRNRE